MYRDEDGTIYSREELELYFDEHKSEIEENSGAATFAEYLSKNGNLEEITMKYTVKAYLCTNFAGLMDSLETDNFYEVQDFIWENCQKGYNCELIDNETGDRNWAYADDFTEETIEPCELIRRS